VLSWVPARSWGLKGRFEAGQGDPLGPESIVKNEVEVWLGKTESQGTNYV
jgi:hypothetical protein